jgi:hypothetical protein
MAYKISDEVMFTTTAGLAGQSQAKDHDHEN